MGKMKEMYKSGYETLARAMNGFAEMFDMLDFEERRKRLIRGLSKESVAVVDRVLNRLRVVVSLKDGEESDLYTDEELRAFAEAKEILHDRIVKLAPDVYIWDGYALPKRHFEPNVFLDGYGFRFIGSIGKIGDRAIIDAGAFIGDSALILSSLTTGRVFAFEPMLENFRHLETTVRLNGLNNVVPVHSALGDVAGQLTMTVGDAGACATVANRIPGEKLRQETVDVITLDGFVRERGIKVGLIKTDVEGAEQILLRGAKETICRDRPILLISIYHNASDFLDIKPLIESWDVGYRFRIYHPPIRSISGETILIAEPGEEKCVELSTHALETLQIDTPNRRAFRACADIAKRSAGESGLSIDGVRVSNQELVKQLEERKKAVAKRDEWLSAEKAKVERRDARIAELDAIREELKKKLKEAQEAVERRNQWLQLEKATVAGLKGEVSDLKLLIRAIKKVVS